MTGGSTVRRVLRSIPPLTLAAITAAIAFAPVVTGGFRSQEARFCGGDNNAVEREFDLAHASDFLRVFPNVGRTPELESDSRPAHVVMFAGNFNARGISVAAEANGQPQILANVVCVITADGFRNVYYDVSKVGAQLP